MAKCGHRVPEAQITAFVIKITDNGTVELILMCHSGPGQLHHHSGSAGSQHKLHTSSFRNQTARK